ncbi:hypothetical protein E2C01_091371 [Portunus trituberculatus]|uniref:Secreted protein n=1 Tax=Portunus trituberculatus TaxID=210409 RepID=A0A5B7JMS5_PORTR|nr:hypothetical protein [Portunus trituberculatus]
MIITALLTTIGVQVSGSGGGGGVGVCSVQASSASNHHLGQEEHLSHLHPAKPFMYSTVLSEVTLPNVQY